MADVTVSQLAESIKVSIDRLLQLLQEVGLHQGKAEDIVSEDQKHILLDHFKKAHGDAEGAPKKITLTRRTIGKLKTGGAAGRGRTVNVEVRKKRTYVRKSEAEDPEVKEAPVVQVVPSAPGQTVEEEARRRQANAELEAEADNRRQEAAKKAVEAKEKAREIAERKEEAQKKAKEAEAKKEKELEESKISARKDKRDRHDLDETDTKEKRSKHGNRKRLVEELLGEEVEEILDDAATGAEGKVVQLSLATSRPKRATSPQGPKHQFTAPTEEIKREVVCKYWQTK